MPGGGRPAAAPGAPPGIWRMFNASWGGQIAWLLPAALVFVVVLLWLTRRAPRTDRTRAGDAPVGRHARSSRSSCSASARASSTSTTPWPWRPPIAALVGMGCVALWERRRHLAARLTLAGGPRRDRRLGVRPAGPLRRLAPLAALRRAGRRPCRGRAAGDRRTRRPASRPRRRAGRPGRRAGRPRRVLAADRGHGAHRLAAHGRPHRGRRHPGRTRRWRRPRARRHAGGGDGGGVPPALAAANNGTMPAAPPGGFGGQDGAQTGGGGSAADGGPR